MGEGSPLFSSAIELLAHAIEHYASGTERDRRFMILHLANAVELLLKDICVDLGQSLYEDKRGSTKGVWDVMKVVESHGVHIHHKPIVELLIEERNNIQHRFGSESEIMATWYMEKMLEFFADFVDSRFSLSLRDYLADFVGEGALERVFSDPANLDPFAAARQSAKIQPSGAFVAAWIEIEKQMNELRDRVHSTGEPGQRQGFTPTMDLIRRAARLQADESGDELAAEYRELQRARASVLHGRAELQAAEAVAMIDRMALLLPRLRKLTDGVSQPEAASGAHGNAP